MKLIHSFFMVLLTALAVSGFWAVETIEMLKVSRQILGVVSGFSAVFILTLFIIKSMDD